MSREDFMEAVVGTAAEMPVVRHALKRIYGITVKVGKRTPKGSRPMSDEQRVHGRHCS
jgi:hypothetical protein